jgi:hypothetical protein
MKKKKAFKRKSIQQPIPQKTGMDVYLPGWAILAKGLWKKTPVWTVFFWAWIVWVSMWLDNAPAEQMNEIKSAQKLMNIEFTGMRFEQKYADGMQLIVESPNARIDEASKVLTIEKPVLSHVRGKDTTYTASGETGIIQLELTTSALPSTFKRLTIIGNAMAKSGATTVTANTLIFDCSAQKFYTPGRYESEQSGMLLRGENMEYDPVSNQIRKIQQDEMNEILSNP